MKYLGDFLQDVGLAVALVICIATIAFVAMGGGK